MGKGVLQVCPNFSICPIWACIFFNFILPSCKRFSLFFFFPVTLKITLWGGPQGNFEGLSSVREPRYVSLLELLGIAQGICGFSYCFYPDETYLVYFHNVKHASFHFSLAGGDFVLGVCSEFSSLASVCQARLEARVHNFGFKTC